jgi:hypothetical protein
MMKKNAEQELNTKIVRAFRPIFSIYAIFFSIILAHLMASRPFGVALDDLIYFRFANGELFRYSGSIIEYINAE